MKLTNQNIAEYLIDIATAYEIKKKNRFRIIAYQNAADTVNSYPENLHDLWLKDPKLLDSIPNIGPSILKKIDYYFGHRKPYPALNKIFKNIHPSVFTFTKINGIGPLNAYKLTQNLKFSKKPTKSLYQLIKYAKNGKIRSIPSFGEKSEKLILDNTLAYLGRKERMTLALAQKLADHLIDYLHHQFPEIEFIPLGSLRRLSPTIGDIDLAAASNQPQKIIRWFVEYPKSIQIISQGKSEASIRLIKDIHVDLMVKPPSSFGSLLQHFTGSRQHNIILRKLAQRMGYSLSEYGIKDIKTGVIYHFDTEEKFYKFLGFRWIPPAERVGESEFEKYKVV